MPRVPDFIGIGAAKCGTTWVSTVLDDHPDVAMAPAKEVVYFYSKNYALGRDWYVAQFAGLDASKIIGEWSVAYLREAPDVAPRIHDLRPDMKLVAVLRDPLERALSHYNWIRQIRGAPPGDGEILDPARGILGNSLYHDKLQPFWSLFGQDRVLLLTYESLTADPAAGFSRLFAFLGARPDILPAAVLHREGGTVAPRSRLLEAARQRTHRYLRRHGHGHLISRFKRMGLSRLYRRLNDGGARLRFAPETERRLTDILQPQVERIARDTDLDVSSWLGGRQPARPVPQAGVPRVSG